MPRAMPLTRDTDAARRAPKKDAGVAVASAAARSAPARNMASASPAARRAPKRDAAVASAVQPRRWTGDAARHAPRRNVAAASAAARRTPQRGVASDCAAARHALRGTRLQPLPPR